MYPELGAYTGEKFTSENPETPCRTSLLVLGSKYGLPRFEHAEAETSLLACHQDGVGAEGLQQVGIPALGGERVREGL